MKFSFGPYRDDELEVLLHEKDPTQRKQAYQNALDRYRDFVRYMDEQLRQHPDPTLTTQLNRDRTILHEQAMQIARYAGKTGREFFADLISREANLASRGLPEFQTLTWEQIDRDLYGDEDGLENHASERATVTNTIEGVEDVPVVHTLAKGEIGVVFFRAVTVAIPSYEDLQEIRDSNGYVRLLGTKFALEAQGDPERIRRAARLAKKTSRPLLVSSDFSHNYRTMVYAIVVDKGSLDEVAGELRNHRETFGIRMEDLDADIVAADWEEYQRNVARTFSKEDRVLFDHTYRKMHDPAYRVTDRELLHAWEAEQARERKAEEDSEGDWKKDAKKKVRPRDRR